MLLSGSVVLLLLTVQPLFGPVAAGGEVAGADEQLPRRTNCLLMSTARSGMRASQVPQILLRSQIYLKPKFTSLCKVLKVKWRAFDCCIIRAAQ